MLIIIETIKQRIRHFADSQGISKRQICIESGLSNGVLDKPGGLNEESIMKFINSHPQISTRWLLFGEKPMLRLDKEVSTVEESHSEYKTSNGQPFFDSNLFEAIKDFSLDKKQETRISVPGTEVDFWATASTNDLAPSISSGDIIGLAEINQWQDFLIYGEKYAIQTAQFVVLRTIQKSEDANKLKLVNASKQIQEIEKKHIQCVFLIPSVIKKSL